MGMVYSWVYRFTSPATQSEMCFEFAIAFYGSSPKILPREPELNWEPMSFFENGGHPKMGMFMGKHGNI